jgi:hypothetical protein
VGGLVVSRALRDVSLANNLREASMAVALGLLESNELQNVGAERGLIRHVRGPR